MRVAKLVLLAAIFFIAGAAHSQTQTTVGQLLDQGARKLSSEEVKVLLTGATAYADRGRGVVSKTTFNPDGSASASLQTMDSRVGGRGTWKMEGDGKYCVSLQWTSVYPPYAGCLYNFKLGEKYFVSESDSERNASAGERTYSR